MTVLLGWYIHTTTTRLPKCFIVPGTRFGKWADEKGISWALEEKLTNQRLYEIEEVIDLLLLKGTDIVVTNTLLVSDVEDFTDRMP